MISMVVILEQDLLGITVANIQLPTALNPGVKVFAFILYLNPLGRRLNTAKA